MVARAQVSAGTILFLTALAVAPLRADPVTIFSNFGPNLEFQDEPTHGWTINGFFSPSVGQQAISQLFTPSRSYLFERVRLALTLFPGPTAIDLFLQADNDGLPGAVKDVIPLHGLRTGTAVVSGQSVAQPLVFENNPYWLTVVAGAPGVLAGWNWNSTGDVSDGHNFAATQGGSPAGPWGLGLRSELRSAFEIQGQVQPTPEPSSLVLLATACVVFRRSARRRAAQRHLALSRSVESSSNRSFI
jgi:hypothetical protein